MAAPIGVTVLGIAAHAGPSEPTGVASVALMGVDVCCVVCMTSPRDPRRQAASPAAVTPARPHGGHRRVRRRPGPRRVRPPDVFYFANHLARQAGDPAPYTVHVAARAIGPVPTASGPAMYADRAVCDPGLRPDVLLVAGGLAVGAAAADRALVADLAALATRSGEMGSVCTGTLLLAEAGLLDGRRATTHWALAALLADAHPGVHVDDDPIYLHDGVWTSAGVTAGIDLARPARAHRRPSRR